MSGNERTYGGFGVPSAKIKSGYTVTESDSLVLTTELMNMEDKEKYAWVTITYEVLDGSHPDFRQGKNVFMFIGNTGCEGFNMTNPFGVSNVTQYQQPKSMAFAEHSIPWKSPADGYILATGE